MLTKKLFFFLLVCFAISSCCEKEDTVPDEDTTTATSVIIMENPDGPPKGPFIAIPGTSSTLDRDADGISVTFNTENLIPNNVYTMWFVVFGDAPGPPILSYHAAGHVIGKDGKGNFSAYLGVGDIFKSPLTAEVHMALRTHGPAQTGMILSQLQTLQGGCTSGFPTGPALYPDLDVVGYCANVQVAMHPGK